MLKLTKASQLKGTLRQHRQVIMFCSIVWCAIVALVQDLQLYYLEISFYAVFNSWRWLFYLTWLNWLKIQCLSVQQKLIYWNFHTLSINSDEDWAQRLKILAYKIWIYSVSLYFLSLFALINFAIIYVVRKHWKCYLIVTWNRSCKYIWLLLIVGISLLLFWTCYLFQNICLINCVKPMADIDFKS